MNCPHCGKTIRPASRDERLERSRRRNKRFRVRRAEQGLCLDCPKPAITGKSRCQYHLTYHARLNERARSSG